MNLLVGGPLGEKLVVTLSAFGCIVVPQVMILPVDPNDGEVSLFEMAIFRRFHHVRHLFRAQVVLVLRKMDLEPHCGEPQGHERNSCFSEELYEYPRQESNL